MIFSYVTVIPALLSGYLWWRKSVAEIKLADTLSLYGYCLTLFIPISVSPSLQIPYSDIGYLSFIIERGRVLPLINCTYLGLNFSYTQLCTLYNCISTAGTVSVEM